MTFNFRSAGLQELIAEAFVPGAGMAGADAALHLQKRGRDVLTMGAFDPAPPCCAGFMPGKIRRERGVAAARLG